MNSNMTDLPASAVNEALRKKSKRRVRAHSGQYLNRPVQETPMRLGFATDIISTREKKLQNIKEENDSEVALSTGGYQTVLFNMMWLISTRVAKLLREEPMDEELFRGYFVRLYRKIVQIEKSLWRALDDDLKESFVSFSKSLSELAFCFKVQRDPTASNPKKIGRELPKDEQVAQAIFGLGSLPNIKQTGV